MSANKSTAAGKRPTDTTPRTLVPATDEDNAHLRFFFRAMPFAGAIFEPHCRAVEAEPLPPLNARGGRDAEGWTAVYEAIVQESEFGVRGGQPAVSRPDLQ